MYTDLLCLHCYSLGPFEAAAGSEMVSRRRILSRSRDDLTQAFAASVEEEEDVWYQKDKLYKVSKNTPKYYKYLYLCCLIKFVYHSSILFPVIFRYYHFRLDCSQFIC